ncbi:MAG: hypothetical protein KGH79_00865 [Patescibacteria group bacterium]|nr:hypothetical protein [Patescibacteria group bacterium]
MKRIIFATIIAGSIILVPVLTFAQSNPATGGVSNPVSGGQTSYTVQNPLAANSFCGLVQNLLKAALAIGIPIAVLFIVYAGFKFVLAQGNSTKLEEARNNFMWTVVGIGIFLGAWLLASVVANTINALGSGGNQPNIISCN